MEYILPRMECIVLSGINFDLTINIPHNYVPECCREAFGNGSQPQPSLGKSFKEVKELVNRSCPKDKDFLEYIRFFLDIVYVLSFCFIPGFLLGSALFMSPECSLLLPCSMP